MSGLLFPELVATGFAADDVLGLFEFPTAVVPMKVLRELLNLQDFSSIVSNSSSTESALRKYLLELIAVILPYYRRLIKAEADCLIENTSALASCFKLHTVVVTKSPLNTLI